MKIKIITFFAMIQFFNLISYSSDKCEKPEISCGCFADSETSVKDTITLLFSKFSSIFAPQQSKNSSSRCQKPANNPDNTTDPLKYAYTYYINIELPKIMQFSCKPHDANSHNNSIKSIDEHIERLQLLQQKNKDNDLLSTFFAECIQNAKNAKDFLEIRNSSFFPKHKSLETYSPYKKNNILEQ